MKDDCISNLKLKLKCTINKVSSRAYVTNYWSDTVSVIDTANNTVIETIRNVGGSPQGIAITPDGSRAYVTNSLGGGNGKVTVIDTKTNTVEQTIGVNRSPQEIAITPDGSRAYITNDESKTVTVIDTERNEVIGDPIIVGNRPRGIAIAYVKV